MLTFQGISLHNLVQILVIKVSDRLYFMRSLSHNRLVYYLYIKPVHTVGVGGFYNTWSLREVSRGGEIRWELPKLKFVCKLTVF
jgi:hypothetical protein